MGTSRPNRDMPVVLHATICGFPVAPLVRSSARLERSVAMPFRQTSGSSIVMDAVNLAPMVEMISSTSFPSEANRILETAAVSCALPSMIWRLGVVSGGRMAVSLEGVRQRAIHWWPAARVCLSAERPTPVLAPRKATVLVFVVIVVVA